MRSIRVALLVLLCAPLLAESERGLSYAPVLGADHVVRGMAAMLDDSTRAPRGTEIAAFLLIDPSGGYRLQRWERTAEFRRQSFTGVIPPRTIGIVHTHPNGWARPSSGDRSEARRIGLPIWVVTRWDIWVAEPDGRVLDLVRNRDWRDDLVESGDELRAEDREP